MKPPKLLHVIPTEILQKVVDYLMKQPYNQVSVLINEVTTQSAQLPPPEAPAEEKNEQ